MVYFWLVVIIFSVLSYIQNIHVSLHVRTQVREGQSTLPIFSPSWYPGIELTISSKNLTHISFCANTFQHASCQHSILSSQSYDAQFLRIYPELSPTPLQLEEDLEQLKVLENGYKMKVLYHLQFSICLLTMPS